ncbi:MAG: helix-turn-helix transcriptional regulator [Gemmatimonadota bacterium]|nr:helix-turn-helix transcriptional regulator [Gemmatimonadota bacterium]
MSDRAKRISRHLARSIARNITHFRRQQKMSQAELAYEADVSISTLGRLESGQADPRMSTLESVAASLRVPLSELVSRDWMAGKTADGAE